MSTRILNLPFLSNFRSSETSAAPSKPVTELPHNPLDRFESAPNRLWRRMFTPVGRSQPQQILPPNDLACLYTRLGNLNRESGVEVKTLGSVDDLPIHLIEMRGTSSAAKKNVLICAGVHGNEPSGVSAVFELISELRTKPHLGENFNFYILPCVNPHGFKAGERRNPQDVDLNRAFAIDEGQPEAEIAVVKPFMEKMSFDLVLDLHSALPKRNGYFVLHRSDLDLLKPAMQNFAQDWPVLSNGSKPYKEEAPGICTSKPKGTLKDYLAESGCPHVVTLEAPRAMEFNQRVRGLSRLAGSIIDQFALLNGVKETS